VNEMLLYNGFALDIFYLLKYQYAFMLSVFFVFVCQSVVATFRTHLSKKGEHVGLFIISFYCKIECYFSVIRFLVHPLLLSIVH